MIAAIFDCNVVMAAIGWRNEPYQCLVSVAKKQTQPYVTDFIVEEYRRTALAMETKGVFSRSVWPMLDWFLSACRHVDPVPLVRQRSRDANDDPYIACGLAAKAKFIISRDPDLLSLQKPFGIAILTPRQFLSYLAGSS
jgi:putative PIN family toxin of toxin-antitoxin system